MKKIILVLFIFLICFPLFAEENIHDITGFPVITENPFPVFNEGVTLTKLNRIILKEDRSNYVWQQEMFGLYFTLESRNMEPCNSMLRIAAYYPIALSFNKHPQIIKNLFNYGIDLFAAPIITFDMWNYIRFNVAPGLHFLFESADRWHFIHLGIGGLLGIELPLAKHWTILLNGIATFDYANLGNNRHIEPYDLAWQYHFDLGFRFSKKSPNKYSYINSRKK